MYNHLLLFDPVFIEIPARLRKLGLGNLAPFDLRSKGVCDITVLVRVEKHNAIPNSQIADIQRAGFRISRSCPARLLQAAQLTCLAPPLQRAKHVSHRNVDVAYRSAAVVQEHTVLIWVFQDSF